MEQTSLSMIICLTAIVVVYAIYLAIVIADWWDDDE